jgi:hypothetical protein
MQGMGTKTALAAGVAIAISNHVGYLGHCEIKPAQCLQNQPEQLHTGENHATASVSSGAPAGLVTGSGGLTAGGSVITGEGHTGSASSVEGAGSVNGSAGITPGTGALGLEANAAAVATLTATLT